MVNVRALNTQQTKTGENSVLFPSRIIDLQSEIATTGLVTYYVSSFGAKTPTLIATHNLALTGPRSGAKTTDP